jgi:uncharacterized cupredoxin-like copper-binding protein
VIVGVGAVLLAVAVAIIAVLATRPSGGLAVPAGSQIVHVDERDFHITIAKTALAPGNYIFVDANHGGSPHELVMWKTDHPAAQLPLEKDGRANEDSPDLDKVLDSGSSLQPGETRLLTVSLDPGHYALVCNLPGHYRAGMHVDITVH